MSAMASTSGRVVRPHYQLGIIKDRHRVTTRPPVVSALLRGTSTLSDPGSAVSWQRGTGGQRGAWLSASSTDGSSSALSIDLDGLLEEVQLPDIDGDLRSYQERAGALFLDSSVAVSYGNDDAALEALCSGVALVDRSHWARIRVAGAGSLDFLHSQTTNDFKSLQAGSGCDTVVVNAQARCLELATCYVQGESVMMVLPPDVAGQVVEHLNKYILYGDEVTLQDVSARCSMLSLAGPEAADLLRQLGADEALLAGAPHAHSLLAFDGKPVVAAVGSGLAGPGYTLICDERVAGELWLALATKGAVPLGDAAWERARVLQGRPRAGAELTADYNPLEAGLYAAVSLQKGCYMGQETLAKVHTRNALKQQLVGLQLQGSARRGGVVMHGDVRLGALTSVVEGEDGEGAFALGYLRCKQGALEGVQVVVDGTPGSVVVDLPFLTRSFADETTQAAAKGAEDVAGRLAEEEAAAQADRAERLRVMQERLAAWQAAQEAAKQE